MRTATPAPLPTQNSMKICMWNPEVRRITGTLSERRLFSFLFKGLHPKQLMQLFLPAPSLLSTISPAIGHHLGYMSRKGPHTHAEKSIP